MQRYHSSAFKSFGLLDAPDITQTTAPTAAGSSRVRFTETAAVPELAACYATPSEGTAEYSDMTREIVRGMTAAARAA
jgi:hypothetical protein